ncbi:SLA2 protein, partial [Casuarius casuarius]|nr:SLA2 protein [Casuarius casuarius]
VRSFFWVHFTFLSGCENSIVQHGNTQLLPLIINKFNTASRKICKPSHLDSPAMQTFQGLCQKGWISYKDHCYMLIEKRMTWIQAEKTWTKRARGHLISITSEAENEFLHKLAQRQKETQFWTGGTYQKASGLSLKWTDGSLTAFIQKLLSALLSPFTRQLISFLNVRFCLTLNTGGHSEWGSSVCNKRLPSICIYKPDLMH